MNVTVPGVRPLDFQDHIPVRRRPSTVVLSATVEWFIARRNPESLESEEGADRTGAE